MPSLLSCNLGQLQAEINATEDLVDSFHIDVMDGQFVPNLTFGAPVFAQVTSSKPFDVHLMVEKPEVIIPDFAKHKNVNAICVHYEVCPHLHKTLQMIKELSCMAGVALNPHTSYQAAKDAIALADYVLIMSVNPGFSGQSFIPDVLPKITHIRTAHPDMPIQIDGGMDDVNAPKAIAAGAHWLVSGSYFWKAENKVAAVTSLKNQ